MVLAAVVVMLTISALTGPAAPSAADDHVDPPVPVELRLTVRLSGPATAGHGHRSTDLSPLYWKSLAELLAYPALIRGGAPCDAANPVVVPLPPGTVVPDLGVVEGAVLWNRASDTFVEGSTPVFACVRPGATLTPPAPPTYAEILAAMRFGLDAPQPVYSPAVRGLTGLSTYGSLAPVGGSAVTRTLAFGAWGVTATATRVGFVWRVDGVTDRGVAVHERFDAPDAATRFEHRFAAKGSYELTVEARWEVTDAILTGAGVTADVSPLGTVYLGAARDYPVVEARAVLRSNA